MWFRNTLAATISCPSSAECGDGLFGDREQVQVDSDGDGTADFEVGLTGYTAADQLTATDFVFSS